MSRVSEPSCWQEWWPRGSHSGRAPGSTDARAGSGKIEGVTTHCKSHGMSWKRRRGLWAVSGLNQVCLISTRHTPAFDKAPKDAPWKLLDKRGCDRRMIRVCKALHEHTLYKMKMPGGTSSSWTPDRGFRERCPRLQYCSASTTTQ